MTWRLVRAPAPEADASAWLEGLNACFPGWGGAARLDWCFRRAGAGRVPDALFLEEDGRYLAGAGVVYRTLELADGRRVRAAIMSGAWTLPEARGKGAFKRLVAATCEAGAERGAPLFAGFVTENNASRRGLETLGALFVAGVYARAAEASASGADLEDLGTPDPEAFRPRPGHAHVAYARDEWRGQFAVRPDAVRTLGARGVFAAVVEEAADLRILALAVPPEGEAAAYGALAAHAARSGRAAFAYATRAAGIRALEAAGFAAVARGFVAFLPTSAPRLVDALSAPDEAAARRLLDLDLSAGDRM